MEIFANLDWNLILIALWETLYMTFVSLIFIVILGFLIGVLLYITQTGGLYANGLINKIADGLVNLLRSIPFIILLIILIPFTRALTGSMLGASAALPSLIVSAAPFYARLCLIAFNEVDKGTIEVSKAMGASNWEIIFKVLLPESLPAIISGISVTGISLISFTAMAGAIGAGGLGNLAYQYGFARRDNVILYLATILIIIIVFIIQFVGNRVVRKIDKR
ncbi:MAG: methionine ABC transporter permease [Erysipelotrichaceae bacterium]